MMASHQQWESDDADDDHYRYDTDNESEDFQTHQIVQKDKCVQFVLFSENLQNKQVNKQIRAYIYPYAHRSIQRPKSHLDLCSQIICSVVLRHPGSISFVLQVINALVKRNKRAFFHPWAFFTWQFNYF